MVAAAAVAFLLIPCGSALLPAAPPTWDTPWHIHGSDSPWGELAAEWESTPAQPEARLDYWERVAVDHSNDRGSVRASWEFASRMNATSDAYGALPASLAVLLHTRLPAAALCSGADARVFRLAEVYLSVSGGGWRSQEWGLPRTCRHNSSGSGCTSRVLPTGVALTLTWAAHAGVSGGEQVPSAMTLEQVFYAVAHATARVSLRLSPFATGDAAALPVHTAGCGSGTITTSVVIPPPDSSHSALSLTALRTLVFAATPCAAADRSGAIDCGDSSGSDNSPSTTLLLSACAAAAQTASSRPWGVGAAAMLVPAVLTAAPWHAAVVSAGWSPDGSHLLHRTTFFAVLRVPATAVSGCTTVPLAVVLGLAPASPCSAQCCDPPPPAVRLQPCAAAPHAVFLESPPVVGDGVDAVAPLSKLLAAILHLPSPPLTSNSLPGASRMAAVRALGSAVVTSTVWAIPACPAGCGPATVEWVEPLPRHWVPTPSSVAVQCTTSTAAVPLTPETVTTRGCDTTNTPCSLHVTAAASLLNCTAIRLTYAAVVPVLPPADALPADVHRGLPSPSGLVQVVCTSGASPPLRLPTAGILLEPPIPDFAMPLNVMTLVPTVLAFLLGRFINVLARRLPTPPPPLATK